MKFFTKRKNSGSIRIREKIRRVIEYHDHDNVAVVNVSDHDVVDDGDFEADDEEGDDDPDFEGDDDTDDDPDFEEGDEVNDFSNNVIKKKKKYSRGQTIRVPNDDVMNKIIRKLGFYKFLRNKSCGEYDHSPKYSRQVVKNSSCFMAYIANEMGYLINKSSAIKIMRQVLEPMGKTALSVYCKSLGDRGYAPVTVAHNVEYIQKLFEWGTTNISQLSKLSPANLNEHGKKLIKKVC